ncbi:MAG: putative lipopolysaccharide heptosyltransferase III [Sutterellaceae bacterium]|nr:putative lipopolysaccharide heptosyltransferase III [Sutterellaceae bacterium]MDY2869005.1 putative lipopolysaccharide heptosyltransferase III [Mesosutterella sp.]
MSSSIKSILVTKLQYHGDVLLMTPVFTLLREKFPEARIDALVYKETAPMIAGDPDINNIYVIDKGWRKLGTVGRLKAEAGLVRALRRNRYDTVIHTTSLPRGAWLTRLLHPKISVAFRKEGKRSRLFNACFSITVPTPPWRSHIVSMHLPLLGPLGIHVSPKEAPGLTMSVPPEAEAEAEKLLSDSGVGKEFILVHPSSRFTYKCWAFDRMASFIDRLAEKGETVVLTGGPGTEERAQIDAIKALLKVARPVDLAGKTSSFKSLAALIRRAKLFVGVNSGPAHVAAAFQVPEVVLFGPSLSRVWHPWKNPRTAIVMTRGKCRCCNQEGCDGNGKSRCMGEIRVEDVLEAAQGVLSLTPLDFSDNPAVFYPAQFPDLPQRTGFGG